MKAFITTIALASALAAGTASATNFQVGQIGGVDVQDNAHYHATGTAMTDSATLPGSSYSSALFVGNK
ncbi:hypothetical protein Q4508_17105 [Amphritea sp. 2_MG-2023]|uniref:hypothetical protein n=1 Tax=Amphritea TaxID=515417 RepID=UPI001C075677|nr:MULTISPECIES: hypothetical protein [Amphritea]MBU2964020.1 hypothetical protein [Amphritea atlantica]MDO6420277.1 hypothetical protein [Amphritea sp. 2_MG-2023]